MHDSSLVEALDRIQIEFAALPGLRLTAEQVNRLCNLPREVCDAALDRLIQAGILTVANDAFERQPAAGVRLVRRADRRSAGRLRTPTCATCGTDWSVVATGRTREFVDFRCEDCGESLRLTIKR